MAGLPQYNFTALPNIVTDEYMAKLGNAELRVLLALIRKTYGWHKDSDKVSLSQLQDITGLTRKSVLAGIAGLEAYQLVICERGTNGGCNYYTVRVDNENAGGIPTPLASELPSIPTPLANAESSIASIPTKESSFKQTTKDKEKELSANADALEHNEDKSAAKAKVKSASVKGSSKPKEKSSAKKEKVVEGEETEDQRVLRVAKSYVPLYMYYYQQYTGGKIAYATVAAKNLAEAKVMASDKRNITPKEFEAYLKHLIDTGLIKDTIPYQHVFPTFERLNRGIYAFVDKTRNTSHNGTTSADDFQPGYGASLQELYLKKTNTESQS